MSEIKHNQVLELLDKFQMFQGQRAGRELWFDKREEIQDKDLENFNRDVEIIRKYVKTTQTMLERIAEQIEFLEHRTIDGIPYINMNEAIEIVKEEGGIE